MAKTARGEAAEFKRSARAQGYPKGVGNPWPDNLKQQALRYVASRPGVTYYKMGMELGLGSSILQRWQRESQGQPTRPSRAVSGPVPAAALREKAPAPSPRHNLTLVGPNGLRVENLDPPTVASLLKDMCKAWGA